jgi:hypothetical protein
MLEHIFSLWGFVTIAVVCGMLGTAISVIAKQWRKAREAEIEASLKAELIKQGRSAEEIEKVLRASGRGNAASDE